MCGILSIINTKVNAGSEQLVKACEIIKHRGPDDEGFLTWQPGEQPVVWAGRDTAASTLSHFQYKTLTPGQGFKVGFGHRRLSILDLSPMGHQPMVYKDAALALTFNGEIYNYLEIKEELEKSGHRFSSTSDTEVILHAWQQWGVKCLDRFNGMFAFIILDYGRKELYAVRDRFGVKPIYYYKGETGIYLASEIKQIKTAPGYTFNLDEQITRQYLATGAVDHTDKTFDTRIKYIPGGHYLHMDLSTGTNDFEIKKWYTLTPKAWKGNKEEAAAHLRYLLTDAVNLRLRSDVAVGSCLSGGLDSSSIVCIAAALLKAKGDFAGQETVTACYENVKYDEWKFAQEVIKATNAKPHRVFPSFKQLQEEIDSFLYYQDEPTGSTSQFSQWAVFKKTHEVGLKVMVDGQGADEQLAGYHGNDIPFYSGLVKRGKIISVIDEARHYKKEKGVWPKGFLLAAMQLNMGKTLTGVLPQNLKITRKNIALWVNENEHGNLYDKHAETLAENLLRQVYSEPLPALLRYEDHNSMAWSVESRTPFMDYRLLEFNLGLPERYLYKRGVRKVILREAMHNILPAAIEARRDKMGFVTPEELWLKGEGKEWFMDGIDKACTQFGGTLLNTNEVHKYVSGMITGKREFDFVPWRIFCFHRWFNNL
jgi:asparagine synthase (glutamine-hydrolysing)